MLMIEVMAKGRAVHSVPLDRPLQIGRAPSCDVVLMDPSVSGTHAQLQADGAHAVLTDLGSRNGTWLGEERVHSSISIQAGDTVRLGLNTWIRLRSSAESQLWPSLRVELQEQGLVHPFASPRLDLNAALSLHRRGPRGVWATHELEDLGPVPLGELIRLQGLQFVIREGPMELQETFQEAALSVSGDLNHLSLREASAMHQVRAPNRVALLYTLARAWLQDAEQAAHERGWRGDAELSSAVWGRQRVAHLHNNYNVLLSRVRAAMRQDGLDPHRVERRPNQTRLRCDVVTLQ